MIRYDWNIMRTLTMPTNILIISALSEDTKNLHVYSRNVLGPISRFQDTSPFLLNPFDLLTNHKSYTESEIYLYLELAAYRSYITYRETGSTRLPTYYIEDVYNLEQLKFNTLLTVTNEEILFRYEEN